MTPTSDLSKHVGLFAIPVDSMGELRQLCARRTQASKACRDDVFVLVNAVYRMARDASSYRCIRHGAENAELYVEVMSVLYRGLKNKNQTLFSPEEVHTMAQKIPRWETRLSGEDKVVARIRKQSEMFSPDDVRAMYRAFKEVIAAAAERDAGFVTAVLREGAEERLAAERAQREQALRDNPPLALDEYEDTDTEESRARQRALDEWVERNNAQYETALYVDSTPPTAQTPTPVHIVLVPKRYAPPLHKLLRQAQALDDYFDIRALRERARARALERSSDSAQLDRYGEVASVNSIIIETMHRYNVPKPVYRGYSLRQTRRFSDAVETWVRERGIDGVLDDIANAIPGTNHTTRTTAAHAFHTVRDALARAVCEQCALFMWGTI